jgi:hypothetical protein
VQHLHIAYVGRNEKTLQKFKLLKMKKLLSFIFLVALTSCTGLYEQPENLIDLGDEYYFFKNGWESYIFLNESPPGEGKKGVTIVLPEIINYKYDNQFIVVKSRHYETNMVNYQIVDKSVDVGLVKSLSKKEYDIKREELNIKLNIP